MPSAWAELIAVNERHHTHLSWRSQVQKNKYASCAATPEFRGRDGALRARTVAHLLKRGAMG
ncbi:MAG TPA: hypothetical protein VFS47_07945 [Steroidobacteraceae bacterium]|nr:hypothetical protein [Steroidobacteraceae bacterium]